MNCLHDDHQEESVRPDMVTAQTAPEARNTDLFAPEAGKRDGLISELEYLLNTHADQEARSDQSSLQDLLTELRNLADDRELDFRAALAGSDAASVAPATLAGFDPCI